MSVRALLAVASMTFAVGSAAAQTPSKSNPQADNFRDELELLSAQTEVRKAQVSAAEMKANAAGEQLKRLEQLGGAISPVELAQLKSVADTAKAEVTIRKAELAEHEVKIAVTKRRLDRALQQPPTADAKEDNVAKLLAAMTAREQADAARQERERKEATERAVLEEKRRAEALEKQAVERVRAEREQVRKQLGEKLTALTAELNEAKARVGKIEATKVALEKELDQLKPKTER